MSATRTAEPRTGAGTSDAAAQPPTAGDLRARDVMTTTLITVEADESVLLAWELIVRAGIHHLPVVRDGHCLGVIDDRTLAGEWIVGPLARQRRQIGDLLPGYVVHVRPDDPLDRVASTMDDAAIDVVAVFDDDEVLCGLVTTRDLEAAVAGRRRRLDDRVPHTAPVLFQLTPALPAPAPRRRRAADQASPA